MKSFSIVGFIQNIYILLYHRRNIIFWILAFIISLIPVSLIVVRVFSGVFSFWFDPARDMIAAWDNLSKLTLIGPPSGVPGIFYGPYWIWLLSFGELFSHDPKIVNFITMTIPYIVFFPLILFRFKKVFNFSTIFLLWMLFLLSYGWYSYTLWNPYPAPILLLLFITLLFFVSFSSKKTKQKLLIFLAGFSLGLLANFHLSLGIGVVFGTINYGIVSIVMGKNKFIKVRFLNFIIITIGFLAAFAPFFVFEIRHGFNQTKAFLNAFLHFGSVVQISGLTKGQIIYEFLGRLGTLFQLPVIFSSMIFFVSIIYMLVQWKRKKIVFSVYERKILIILSSITAGILGIYLSARNPVWDYHFIAVEIIFLLATGIILQRIKLLKIIMFGWVLCLLINFSNVSIHLLLTNSKAISISLTAEEENVKKIQNDAGMSPYTVFVYSPSVYSYEYSYLFRYLYDKNVPYRPELNSSDSNLVYIVFPPNVEKSKYDDFIHYRTSPSQYVTEKQWIMPSKTIILKRIKKQ